jgi:hypothetical protein
MTVSDRYRRLIEAMESIPAEYQAPNLEALVDAQNKYRKHLRDRPYPLRDKAQAAWVIREEYLELEDETRRDIDDTDVSKLLNDYCELAVSAHSAYVDTVKRASAHRAAPAGRLCERCRQRPACHQRADGSLRCAMCLRAA